MVDTFGLTGINPCLLGAVHVLQQRIAGGDGFFAVLFNRLIVPLEGRIDIDALLAQLRVFGDCGGRLDDGAPGLDQIADRFA